MRFILFFPLLLLGVLHLNLAQGTYEDCCLSYVKEVKFHIKKNVESYRRQEQDGGCNLRAILFKLKRGRLFCARPGEKWVQELMKQIDEKVQQKKQKRAKKRSKEAKHLQRTKKL